MKRKMTGILAVLLVAGSVFVVRNMQDTAPHDRESGEETDLGVQGDAESVLSEAESEVSPESAQVAEKEIENIGQEAGESQTTATAQAKEEEEASTIADAQAKAEEEARTAAGTKAKVKEEAKNTAEAQAKAEEEARAAAEAQAGAEEEARAAAEAQARAEEEARAAAGAQMQEAPQTGGEVVEISRTYIEDCGSDSGYWEITYSDGHVEHVDD